MMVWWYKCSVIQLLKAYRTHNWSGLYIFRQILLLPFFLFSIQDHNQNWIKHDKFTFFLVCLMFVPPFFDKWNYNAVYLYMRMLGVCEWKSSNTSLLWETHELLMWEIMIHFCRQFVLFELKFFLNLRSTAVVGLSRLVTIFYENISLTEPTIYCKKLCENSLIKQKINCAPPSPRWKSKNSFEFNERKYFVSTKWKSNQFKLEITVWEFLFEQKNSCDEPNKKLRCHLERKEK